MTIFRNQYFGNSLNNRKFTLILRLLSPIVALFYGYENGYFEQIYQLPVFFTHF